MNQDLARARAQLLRIREEVLRQRGEHRTGEGELLGARESDPVDAAQAEGGAIPLDSLSESERVRFNEVDDALRRIDGGEYGQCEECGQRIAERRLAAIPWARRCFEHEMEFEKEHRGVNVV
jgi:DnaK suppressor protein